MSYPRAHDVGDREQEHVLQYVHERRPRTCHTNDNVIVWRHRRTVNTRKTCNVYYVSLWSSTGVIPRTCILDRREEENRHQGVVGGQI